MIERNKDSREDYLESRSLLPIFRSAPETYNNEEYSATIRMVEKFSKRPSVESVGKFLKQPFRGSRRIVITVNNDIVTPIEFLENIKTTTTPFLQSFREIWHYGKGVTVRNYGDLKILYYSSDIIEPFNNLVFADYILHQAHVAWGADYTNAHDILIDRNFVERNDGQIALQEKLPFRKSTLQFPYAKALPEGPSS